MMLAPAGIIATASSIETALMIETPVSSDHRKGRQHGKLSASGRGSIDLHQDSIMIPIVG
jgi:hypothetical protein